MGNSVATREARCDQRSSQGNETQGSACAGADGSWAQFIIQAEAVAVTAAFAIVGTTVVFKLVDLTLGMRVGKRDELLGLDLSQHSEAGYEI